MPEKQAERIARLALAWRGLLGPMGQRRVLAHFGSARAALEATREELAVPSLKLEPGQVEALLGPARELEAVEADRRLLERENVRVYLEEDEGYPELLRDLRDGPPVLCMAGRLLAEDEPAVAVVGTRSPTAEGRKMARRLGCACAEQQITVVSGLALGVDTAAHEGALRCGGRTVAILGSGIDAVSPRENLELARRIAEYGAVLSEFPPGAAPSSSHLLARNRLQVALSQAVVVVQAGESGGAMHTAERGLHTERLVYAVQWEERGEQTAGNRLLLEQGARALAGPEEIANLARELYVQQERYRRERANRTQMQLFGSENGDPPAAT